MGDQFKDALYWAFVAAVTIIVFIIMTGGLATSPEGDVCTDNGGELKRGGQCVSRPKIND